MALRTTGCATSLLKNLTDLKKKNDSDSLRVYLIDEGCFPPHKDPETASITIEELKKLARAWKLNDRRNFLKANADSGELVSALLTHLENNKKYANTNKNNPNIGTSQLPNPPSETKPSFSPRSMKSSPMKSMMGLSYFNREIDPSELLQRSRLFKYPGKDELVDKMVNKWRLEDFNLKDSEAASDRRQSMNGRAQSIRVSSGGGHSNGRVESISVNRGTMSGSRGRTVKHRILANHLATFSASQDFESATFNLQSIQTFVSVSDSDDGFVISSCMLALSNISSKPSIRSMLIEINAIMKLPNMLLYCKSRQAIWAASLLYYYFSCDSEIEDRIYNSGSSMLMTNGQSEDQELRLATLYTLNNLLPCIDRNRIAELLMTIFKLFFSSTKSVERPLKIIYLKIIQNTCAFSNTHFVLMPNDVLDILAECTLQAMEEDDFETGLLVAKILSLFLVSHETVSSYLGSEYVGIFVDLLKIDDEQIRRTCISCLATMSGIKALLLHVCESEVVSAITAIVDTAKSMPLDIAKSAAKFLSNICQPISKDYLHRLVADSVPIAILQLTRHYKSDTSIQSIAVRGLQNILSNRNNVRELIEICFTPLLKILKETDDFGAIQCFFNIASVPECEDQWLQNKMHVKLLECMCSTKNTAAKSYYLPVLVQMSANYQCVLDLLQDDMISKLETKLVTVISKTGLRDTAKLLLAVMNSKAPLEESKLHSVGRILQRICDKNTDEHAIGHCAAVVAFMSLIMEDFKEVDLVLRAVIALSTSDLVMEGVSTVIYNVSCSDVSLPLLLKDIFYTNIMIRLMRSGVISVQENVANAMRNICSHPFSIDILLKADALSDLIVIALLRTSSMEIKEVCAEAFYNMLCHQHSRLKLLQGDIWWAISRLSRHDSDRIRRMCAQVLYDVSTGAEYMHALRHHHILTFVRDLITNGDDNFFKVCMRAVINIIGRFQGDFAEHEVISAIHISAGVLLRSEHLESIHSAILLLLKCIQQKATGADVTLVNLEIGHVFDKSKALWCKDSMNSLNVCYIFFEMCHQSDYVTRMISLQDLNTIWTAAYEFYTSAEICQYIASTILLYITRDQTTPEVVISLTVWDWILCDAFGVSRSVFHENGKFDNISVMSGSINTSQYSSAAGTSDKSDQLPISSRAIVLSIIAYVINIADENINKFPKEVVDAFVSFETIANPATKANLVSIIHKFSIGNRQLAQHLAESSIFHALKKYLTTDNRRPDKVLAFCSATVMNLSLQPQLIEQIINIPSNGLDTLILEIFDQGLNPISAYEISIALYKTVACGNIKGDSVLNSRFILDALSKISTKLPFEEDIIRLGKFVIGVILDKYHKGISINPAFVQSLYTELLSNSLQEIPFLMNQVKFKDLECETFFSKTLLNMIKPLAITLESYPPREKQWSPVISKERKRMENLSIKIGNQEPLTYSKLEVNDMPPNHVFQKFIHSYKKIELDDEDSLYSNNGNRAGAVAGGQVGGALEEENEDSSSSDESSDGDGERQGDADKGDDDDDGDADPSSSGVNNESLEDMESDFNGVKLKKRVIPADDASDSSTY